MLSSSACEAHGSLHDNLPAEKAVSSIEAFPCPAVHLLDVAIRVPYLDILELHRTACCSC